MKENLCSVLSLILFNCACFFLKKYINPKSLFSNFKQCDIDLN